ncbi:hypothetical protein PITC_019290 [Penicillium italicum]|uniref:Uncharacterized protein n=1 Tax=Penicillium italicum TaxID=40296 RepID=A0A0A2L5F5_PENIT|nr:hypothetical protein PITC_019290 [Penicillium italicum]
MSNREPTRSPYQKNFQIECRSFVRKAEAIAKYAREHPNNQEYDPNSEVQRGLISLLSKIARVKDTGLDMVAETPKCSLVLKQRSYWFIRDLADQTEFEDECDDMEAQLEGLAQKVKLHEIENLWVAGFIESMALHIQDQFYV